MSDNSKGSNREKCTNVQIDSVTRGVTKYNILLAINWKVKFLTGHFVNLPITYKSKNQASKYKKFLKKKVAPEYV